MYSTPDGNEVKLQLSPSKKQTPGGPSGPKTFATPLSPSLTDEVNADDNRALLPSTVNDELFAWLLQHKVDDEQILNYLNEREIDLTELSELENDQLKDLLKDIEDSNNCKLQMIDKNRFIKACTKLRPAQPVAAAVPTQPIYKNQQQIPLAPTHQQSIAHRGSHYQQQQQYVPLPPSSPNAQYDPYAASRPPPPYNVNNMNVRHMSLTSQPQPPQQAYYHPQIPQNIYNPQNQNNGGYYRNIPQQYNMVQAQPQPQQQPHPQNKGHYMHSNSESEVNGYHKQDEYKANRAKRSTGLEETEEITTKGLLDLDEVEKELKEESHGHQHHMHLNTKSSNLEPSSHSSAAEYSTTVVQHKAPSEKSLDDSVALDERNRAISVMTDIPQIQHETIFLQLNRFSNKDDLKNELYSVITRLKKEIRAHKLRIDSFSSTLDKLKTKHASQMDQWNKWYIVELKYLGNEYFNALFKFLSTQIQIEYTYIECFSEKLKRLTKAHDSVNDNIDEWDMKQLQNFVKDTIVMVTKMKVSSHTITKKKALENVKKNIGSLQKEYEKAKQLLATPKCDHTVRQQTIVYFFNTVTNDYNEKNDNLVLTTTYFCEEHLQEKFNSFILDQRCQIHTMYVKQWLINIQKNKEKDKITIKSIYQFIETLIVKFSKLYQIDKVTSSYYYYVERFAYICIISINIIHKILSKLLQKNKGQKEHQKLANKHQYALFCKLLDAKYLSN